MVFVQVLTYSKPPTPDARKMHQDFLKAHGNEGKLFMAGKFLDDTGGMVIWKVGSMEEVVRLSREDPYLKQGYVTSVIKEWSPSLDYSGAQPKTS